MTTEHEVDKGDRRRPKLAGLAKLSHDQLVELSHAVSGELERRAKEGAKKKKPGDLSDKEFAELKRKYFEGDTE